MDTPQEQQTRDGHDRNGPPDLVVGVDGSRIALDAVRWAVAEARLRRAPLRILHAAPYAAGSTDGTLRARNILAVAYTVAHRTDRHVQASTQLDEREPVPALLDAAQHAQLLVVGLGGGERPDEMLLSSVALAISGHSPCPVAVVRGRHRLAADGPVLVGVHDPATDAAALTVAFDDAHRHGGRLVVLHAGHDDPFRHDPAALTPWTTQFPDVPVGIRLVHEHPAIALLSAAAEARLVVLGTRTRGVAARALFGSTSRAVLRSSPVPVVVVNPGTVRPAEARVAEPAPPG